MSVALHPVAFRLLSRQAPVLAPRSTSASSIFVGSKGTFAGAQKFRPAAARFASGVSSRISAASALATSHDRFFGPGTARLSTDQRKSRRSFATATTVMAASTREARVVTYNVLSSSLCEPTYFTHCAPEDLDPPNRLRKLLVKLEPEIAKGAVIGLQEVSQKWAGELHTFFAARGYHMVCSLYGKPFNGYMGIALAVPLEIYDISKVDISRCSDTKKIPREPEKGGGFLRKYFVNFPVDMYRKLSGSRPPQSDWQLARGRFNTIMYATLKCKSTGVEFGVANYHMPCMFRNPKVMTIHSQLAAMYAQRQAGDLPAVLMGDFNLKPGDGGYDLITNGELDAAHEAAPVAPEGEEWLTALTYPMRSAYKVKNGAEPDFTNHARIKDDPPFIDTLDYIFISPTMEVAEVLPLPHRDEVKGPFPAPDEPSDHILLAATLRVPDSK